MRRNVTKELKSAVVERFAGGLPVSTLGLALDLGYTERQATGKNGAYVRLQAWKKAGILTMQASRMGPGETPRIFNFTGRSVSRACLADGLTPFLDDAEVAGWEKSAVRSACRFILGLSQKCSDQVILDAARHVSADELHSLPKRAYDLTLSKGQKTNTAEARRGALKSFLRYVGTHDLVPMVFPSYRDDDPWEVQAMRYFPLERQLKQSGVAHALDSQTRSTYRSSFRVYGRGCQLAFESQGVRYADPANLPIAKLADVRAALFKEGLGRRWPDVGSMLNWIGRVHRVGPRVSAPGGRRHPDYLYPPKGVSARRYDGFLQVFDHHGFPDEFREFFEVYRLMNTLPFDELEAQSDKVPARRRAEPLKDTTLKDHTVSVRHWLGIAVHVLEMKPAEMTLLQVFGTDFSDILAALKARWAEKAKDPNSRVSASKSGGLHAVVVHVGLVAYALWRYLGHEEGQRYRALVGGKTHTLLANLNRQEEGEVTSAERRILFDTYLESRRQAEAINVGRRAAGRTDNVNTVKDLRKIWKRTPPSYWAATLDAMIATIDEWEAKGRDDDAFHEEVLAAMLHGGFIGAGARGAEFTNIRIDRHYPPDQWDERIVLLDARSRKNGAGHELAFWDGAPPAHIESLYKKRTRPYFMQKSGADHSFFFVDTQGKPFGCLEEDENGNGRDGIHHRDRVSSMAAFWSRKATAAALRAGLEIPTEPYSFTLHDLRGVFGLLIFHAAGLQWAMNYLGDRSTDTITGYYTALKGKGIPASERDILKRLGAPPLLQEAAGIPSQLNPRCGVPDYAGFRGQFASLQELHKMGAITDEEFALEQEHLKKEYGLGQRASGAA